jgi:hypothetical protein
MTGSKVSGFAVAVGGKTARQPGASGRRSTTSPTPNRRPSGIVSGDKCFGTVDQAHQGVGATTRADHSLNPAQSSQDRYAAGLPRSIALPSKTIRSMRDRNSRNTYYRLPRTNGREAQRSTASVGDPGPVRVRSAHFKPHHQRSSPVRRSISSSNQRLRTIRPECTPCSSCIAVASVP